MFNNEHEVSSMIDPAIDNSKFVFSCLPVTEGRKRSNVQVFFFSRVFGHTQDSEVIEL